MKMAKIKGKEMRSIVTKGVCVGLLAIAGTVLYGSGASAATFKVHCGSGPSIQDRLDRNASGGDTIEVSGTCVENVVINVPGLSLVAQPGAQIVAADPNSPVVTVQAPRVRIIGFTISGGFDGIRVRNSGSAIISDNTVENNYREGVNVVGSSHAQIEGNKIRHNGFDSNGNPVNRGHGIFVGQSSNAVIVSNEIDGNGDIGVRVADASAARLNDNDVTDNQNDGIDVTLNSSVRLSDPSTSPAAANRINGNGGFGWRCRINSSIWPEQNQNYTGGNGLGNTSIESGCVKQGLLF